MGSICRIRLLPDNELCAPLGERGPHPPLVGDGVEGAACSTAPQPGGGGLEDDGCPHPPPVGRGVEGAACSTAPQLVVYVEEQGQVGLALFRHCVFYYF